MGAVVLLSKWNTNCNPDWSQANKHFPATYSAAVCAQQLYAAIRYLLLSQS